MRDTVGAIFAEEDVARCYYARPPYAPALYQRLLDLAPGRRRALDLGCGPGKVAVVLADHFDEVVALDPSEPMLAEGRAVDEGRHPNIAWTLGKGEAYRDDGGFDLVVAGTSIHWPDHAVLFPKLVRWTPLLAIISQDDPAPAPCGEAAWLDFLQRWLAIRMAEVTPGVRKPLRSAPLRRRGSSARGLDGHRWTRDVSPTCSASRSRSSCSATTRAPPGAARRWASWPRNSTPS